MLAGPGKSKCESYFHIFELSAIHVAFLVDIHNLNVVLFVDLLQKVVLDEVYDGVGLYLHLRLDVVVSPAQLLDVVYVDRPVLLVQDADPAVVGHFDGGDVLLPVLKELYFVFEVQFGVQGLQEELLLVRGVQLGLADVLVGDIL